MDFQKREEGMLRAWKTIGELFVFFMGVENFESRILPKCLTSGQPRTIFVDAV